MGSKSITPVHANWAYHITSVSLSGRTQGWWSSLSGCNSWQINGSRGTWCRWRVWDTRPAASWIMASEARRLATRPQDTHSSAPNHPSSVVYFTFTQMQIPHPPSSSVPWFGKGGRNTSYLPWYPRPWKQLSHSTAWAFYSWPGASRLIPYKFQVQWWSSVLSPTAMS